MTTVPGTDTGGGISFSFLFSSRDALRHGTTLSWCKFQVETADPTMLEEGELLQSVGTGESRGHLTFNMHLRSTYCVPRCALQWECAHSTRGKRSRLQVGRLDPNPVSSRVRTVASPVTWASRYLPWKVTESVLHPSATNDLNRCAQNRTLLTRETPPTDRHGACPPRPRPVHNVTMRCSLG